MLKQFSPGTVAIVNADHDVDDMDNMVVLALAPHPRKSLWCSAISNNSTVVIGGTQSSVVLSPHQTHFTPQTYYSRSDIFCVDFRTEHVYAAASRDGVLTQIDRRLPAASASTALLRHPASINRAIYLDNYVFVSGIRNSIALYDIRMAGTLKGTQKSDTLMSFRGHQNDHQLRLGFDVHPNHRIIAAMGDDGQLRFWSFSDSEPFSQAKDTIAEPEYGGLIKFGCKEDHLFISDGSEIHEHGLES